MSDQFKGSLSNELADFQNIKWQVFDEISTPTTGDSISLVTQSNGYWYYSVSVPGVPFPKFCRCRKDNHPFGDHSSESRNEEETLLDLNEEFSKWGLGQLGVNTVNPSGDFLAYSLDTSGNELYTLRIRDIGTGETICDEVNGAKAGGTWVNDHEFIFIAADNTGRRAEARLLNTLTNRTPETVFAEDDPCFSVDVGRTRSGKYVLLEVASATTSEYWYLDTASDDREFHLFDKRSEGVLYRLDHALIGGFDHWVYVVADSLEGPKVCIQPIEPSGTSDRIEIWSSSSRTCIKKFDIYRDFIVMAVKESGVSKLLAFETSRSLQERRGFRVIAEFEISQKVELFAEADWSASSVSYLVESYFTPPSVKEIEIGTGYTQLLRASDYSFKTEDCSYEAAQVTYESHDGVDIPVTILWNSKKRNTTTRPLFLYVYGAYGTSIEAGFSTSRLSLLDRGVVFAIAHVRGGGELGKNWHDSGRKLLKKNSFLDCKAVIDGLIVDGWTNPGQIILRGDSAGALIPGVLLNEIPEMLLGVQMVSPFLDPITELKNDQSHLSFREIDEWGDVADPEVEEYITSFSPIDNLNATLDCNVFVRLSPDDPRVDFDCAIKWAKLVDERKKNHSVVVSVDEASGHQGALNQIKNWENIAEEITWCLKMWNFKSVV